MARHPHALSCGVSARSACHRAGLPPFVRGRRARARQPHRPLDGSLRALAPRTPAGDFDKGAATVVHGGADENPGTPPLQARRFVHALVGEGVPVRYVELPYEGHHYLARESVLHAAAEMIDWLNRTIGPDTSPP